MKKILVPLIIVFVLGYLSVSCSEGGGESESSKEIKVCTYAQIEIEDSLKSPSTADHPSCRSNTYTKLSDDKYVVDSYVDAQNSFGGTVRTNYECTVRLTDGDTYYINCNMLDY
jgi:hypothetical protein